MYQKHNNWEGYNLGNTDPDQRGLDRWRHRRSDSTTIATIGVLVLWVAILIAVGFAVWLSSKK